MLDTVSWVHRVSPVGCWSRDTATRTILNYNDTTKPPPKGRRLLPLSEERLERHANFFGFDSHLRLASERQEEVRHLARLRRSPEDEPVVPLHIL